MEIGLFAHGNGEYIPSNYTSYTSVLSAVRKDKTHRWAQQNLTLQRSGLNAGSESVRKWSKHRKELDGNLAYWKKRSEEGPRGFQSAQEALGSGTEALQAPGGGNQAPVPQETRRRGRFWCCSRLRRANL